MKKIFQRFITWLYKKSCSSLTPPCEHDYKSLGYYYEEYYSEYSNCNDSVTVYEKRKCNKCGRFSDKEVSTKIFLPERYNHYASKKSEYIEQLKRRGVGEEIDCYLRENSNEACSL